MRNIEVYLFGYDYQELSHSLKERLKYDEIEKEITKKIIVLSKLYVYLYSIKWKNKNSI